MERYGPEQGVDDVVARPPALPCLESWMPTWELFGGIAPC